MEDQVLKEDQSLLPYSFLDMSLVVQAEEEVEVYSVFEESVKGLIHSSKRMR